MLKSKKPWFLAFFYFCTTKSNNMGKGDKRTKKGKIVMGTYGVSRPARPKKKDGKAEGKKSS